MENLNAEQVMKALECCTRGRKSKDDRPCDDCPYNECNLVGGTSERQTTGTCQGWLMKDALALITSQEQRIKELAEELDDAKRDTIPKLRWSLERANAMGVEADKTIEKLTEENERLREDNEIKSQKRATIFEIANAFERGHTDGVRKMQERLKAEMRNTAKYSFGGREYSVIGEAFIDQIAKELLEGKK